VSVGFAVLCQSLMHIWQVFRGVGHPEGGPGEKKRKKKIPCSYDVMSIRHYLIPPNKIYLLPNAEKARNRGGLLYLFHVI